MAICGCYFIADTPGVNYYGGKREYLPLVGSEVTSTILSTTSSTVLKQTFTNPSSEAAIKECVYTFPLYDGVSVVNFTCRIGDKVLHGIVKEKVKAKEIFDKAVSRGETAGLLVQDAQASDVFSTKLGNIPKGEKVLVEITYVGELKHEGNGIRFTIPTKVAPRYGGSQRENSSNVAGDGGMKITVDVSMHDGTFIEGLSSPSHPISVSIGKLSTATKTTKSASNNASATLALGDTSLDQDFVLNVEVKDLGTPKAILETHPTISNHRALMVSLVPKFKLPPSRPEIIFVADRSGSMSGNIPSLISAMKVFLKSMPVGVKFNICSFGNGNSFLWPKSKAYSKESLDQASKHIETFDANMGGTETMAAIKATIEKRYGDIPLEIMLLTDGDIWDQEALFSYVNKQVRDSGGKIRIFPLGIGSGVSHALINGLARAGNGFAQAVQPGERLDAHVVRMLRASLSPHITDYSLEVKYSEDNDDFELIESVTDGLKVLLSDVGEPAKQESKEKANISLFDADVEMEDTVPEVEQPVVLPSVPVPKLLQAPHKIPSLFPGAGSVVYLLMSPETIQQNPTSVILRATSIHGPLELSIPIEILTIPAKTIHQLAAKKAVQDLEEGRGWIYDAKDQNGVLVKNRYPSQFDDLVKREAVRLGEQFQIANKWCSFVAVKDNGEENGEKEAAENEDKDEDEVYKLQRGMCGELSLRDSKCRSFHCGPNQCFAVFSIHQFIIVLLLDVAVVRHNNSAWTVMMMISRSNICIRGLHSLWASRLMEVVVEISCCLYCQAQWSASRRNCRLKIQCYFLRYSP